MVPTAIDPNDSVRLQLLAIFQGDLPGEGDDSQNDQLLRGVYYPGGERD
jgi:hypothetical protein